MVSPLSFESTLGTPGFLPSRRLTIITSTLSAAAATGVRNIIQAATPAELPVYVQSLLYMVAHYFQKQGKACQKLTRRSTKRAVVDDSLMLNHRVKELMQEASKDALAE